MADTKISALTAVSAAAKSMLIPVVEDPGGTPVTKKMTITQLLNLGAGTVTVSTPILDMSQTWNDGAVTFTGLKFNFTDTASTAASMLIDLKVGGVTKFDITKAGLVRADSYILQSTGTLAWGTTSSAPLLKADSAGLKAMVADQSANTSVEALLFKARTGTITTSQPAIDVTQTWNDGGVTFKAMLINVTSTASAAASLLIDAQVGGSSVFSVRKDGRVTVGTGIISDQGSGQLALGSGSGTFYVAAATTQTVRALGTANYSWGATIGIPTTYLYEDAANTLAQRNGTAAQSLRIYNTYTDASNYERGVFGYSSNTLVIGHEAAGTGLGTREVVLRSTGNRVTLRGGTATGVRIEVDNGAVACWNWNASGHLLAITDNTYDIGALGATRPRNAYIGQDIVCARHISAGQTNHIFWAASSKMQAPSDGVILISNNAVTAFTRLQLGGTSTSFPAIKRDGAGIKFVVADDTASADIECLSLKTGAPSGGTAAKWKGGVLVTAAVTPDTTRYIELDVAGTLYKVIVST